MRTLGEVYLLYTRRKAARGQIFERMRAVQQQYNSEVVVPLPELDSGEKAAVPNLLMQGLDQMSMRVASTMPDINYPPLRPGIQRSEDLAEVRRKANFGWWEHSALQLQQRRRVRWLLGYGMTCAVITPDFQARMPQWSPRNPLGTYPGATRHPDDLHPQDCIFAYSKTGAQLQATYGVTVGANSEQSYQVVEYVDADMTLIAALGPDHANPGEQNTFSGLGKEIINIEPSGWVNGPTGRFYRPGVIFATLDMIPNRAGTSPAVVAGRITLDRLGGMFDSTMGMYQMQARLMALENIAVERAVFPDEWLVARPGEVPEIVTMAEGRRGIVGVVSGGMLESHNLQPGVQTGTTLDRLERAQRMNGGIPSEFGNESGTNIRTGRRGDSVLSATIDFPIQESQQIMAAALQQENKIAVAVDKGYFDVPKSFYVSWRGAKGKVDYTPSVAFETDNCTVVYSHLGSDANGVVVGLGQRLGIEEMSLHTARRIDPMIDDPDFEERQITVEALHKTVLTSIEQAGQQGAMSADDLAFIAQQVSERNATLFEAVQKAQARAQARQASAGPPGTPEGPVQPGSPEAQPGLAAGTPAEAGAGQPIIAPPSSNLGNLSDLLAQLHRPQVQAR